MTRVSPLLKELLTQPSGTRIAPADLRTVAEENPQRAPEAIDALRMLLETPPEQFRRDKAAASEAVEEQEQIEVESAWPGDEMTFEKPEPDSALTALHTEITYLMYNHEADQNHQEASLWALGKLAPRYPDLVAPNLELVLELVDSDRVSTREYALYTVGRLATETPADPTRCVTEALVPALNNGTTGEQALAAWAISGIATKEPQSATEAIPALCPLLVHDHEYLRINAAEALCLLASLEPENVVSAEYNCIEGVSDEEFATVCAYAIARVSDGVSVEPELVSEESIEAVLNGYGVLTPLVEELVSFSKDSEPAVRTAGAVALVYLSSCADSLSELAMPRLNQLTSDPDQSVAATTQRLLQKGPFNPNQGDVPDIDPGSYAVDLPVQDSTRDDEGGNRAYVGSQGAKLEIEGYNTYDSYTTAVRVEGPDGTSLVNVCDPYESKDGVELNHYIQQHIGVTAGDTVTLQPERLRFAENVIVQLPADVQFTYSEPVESGIKQSLRSQPVQPGDVVPVRVIVDPAEMSANGGKLGNNATIPVSIAATTPSEPVLLTEDTQVTVERDAGVEFGEWWGTSEEYADVAVEVRPVYEIGDEEYQSETDE